MHRRFPDFDGKVDRWRIIHFESPSTICIDAGVAMAGTEAPQGDRSQGVFYGLNIDVPLRFGDRTVTRSYSIVDSAADGVTVAINVLATTTSRDGAAIMHALEPGDPIEITQPILDFPLRIRAPRYVLLAGRIGITAIARMAAALALAGADYTLVYLGRRGLNLASIDDRAELSLCGPICLMDAVRRAWIEREFPIANLTFETFGNSGWFAAEEFTTRVLRLGIEAVDGASPSMLEALEEAGADMMFDCRKGQCGLCGVRILELEGDIDHPDVVYSERQKNAWGKICCCVSRAGSLSGTPAVVTIGVS